MGAASEERGRPRPSLASVLALPVIYLCGAPFLSALVFILPGLVLWLLEPADTESALLALLMQPVMLILNEGHWIYLATGAALALVTLISSQKPLSNALAVNAGVPALYVFTRAAFDWLMDRNQVDPMFVAGTVVLVFIGTMLVWWSWRRAPAVTLVGSMAALLAYSCAFYYFREEISHFTWF